MADLLVDYVIKRKYFSSSQTLSDVYDDTLNEVLSILLEEIDKIIFIDNETSASIDLSKLDKDYKDSYEDVTRVDHLFDVIRWCSDRMKKRIETRSKTGSVHFIDGVCEEHCNWIDEFVRPEWKTQFLKFIESGECSKEFEFYISNNKNCQKAIDIAFEIKSKNLENFARAVKERKIG